jgi:mRNA interferase RelE/StbE
LPWTIEYHPNVRDDFRQIGRTDARMVQKVIEDRLQNGEPEKVGKPLSGDLVGFRRLRTGALRIVFKVQVHRITVFVLAVGQRRNDGVYKTAVTRVK